MCMCVCVCVCVFVCVCARALRIVSMGKTLRFTNALIINQFRVKPTETGVLGSTESISETFQVYRIIVALGSELGLMN